LKITREIKTAILVISSILLFIWGYSFLKGRDLLTDYKTLYAEYDNVEGLTASAPITINGLIIGKVQGIKFLGNTGKLQVELQIKSDFPISKSSIAALYEPGLIAGKQIQIIPNYEDKNMAVTGDVLQSKSIPGLTALVGEKLTPLQENLDKVLTNADVLLTNVNNVLDKDSQQNLKKAIAELRITMEEFHKASGTLNGILVENKGKIDGIVTNFNKVSKDFSSISDSLQRADLGKTAKNLQKTLDNVDKIIAGVESGKGTLGKLMKDDALYTELTTASKELEMLLQDVRLNPTRYINVSLFGKKNKPYIAPVNDTIKK
jgi:phospholipid/cholesterol/gamma-HCH transport system substrate-binding protein